MNGYYVRYKDSEGIKLTFFVCGKAENVVERFEESHPGCRVIGCCWGYYI